MVVSMKFCSVVALIFLSFSLSIIAFNVEASVLKTVGHKQKNAVHSHAQHPSEHFKKNDAQQKMVLRREQVLKMIIAGALLNRR